MIRKELKPCPFCGSVPECGVEFYSSCGREVKLSAVVECTGCGIRKREIFKATNNIWFTPFHDYYNAFEKVIKEWNKRIGRYDELLDNFDLKYRNHNER